MLKILNKFCKKTGRKELLDKSPIFNINIVRYNEAFGRILIDAEDINDKQIKYYILLIDEKRFNASVFRDVDTLFLLKRACKKKQIIISKLKDDYKFKNKKTFQIKTKSGFIYYKSKFKLFKGSLIKVSKSLGSQ